MAKRTIRTAGKPKAQLEREIKAVTGTAGTAGGDASAARAREISQRRIAALIANGEDVRNTPAWRDAMDEAIMVGVMTGAKSARPVADRSGPAKVTAKNLTDLQIHQVWSTTADPDIADSCRSALGIGSPIWMVRQAARAAVAEEYNARKAAGLALRTTYATKAGS